MNAIVRFSLLLLMATVLLSCRRHSVAEQKARAYLQPLLYSGESTANIVARFGVPYSRAETSVPGFTTMYFQFTGKDRAALPTEVFGFTAFITNNQLVKWEPNWQQ
jgi:hypothetical protein